MSRAVAIGDARRLAGYGLAGTLVMDAATPAEVERAWSRVGDAGLVVLTPESHAVLEARLDDRDDLVWVVLPW